MISHNKQPRPLTNAHANFEWPAQVNVGALFLEPSHRQGMQRSYEKYSDRLRHFVNWIVL